MRKPHSKQPSTKYFSLHGKRENDMWVKGKVAAIAECRNQVGKKEITEEQTI